MLKSSIRKIGDKFKEIKARTLGIIIERAIMFNMKTTTAIITSRGVIMVTEIIKVGHMFHLKIAKDD